MSNRPTKRRPPYLVFVSHATADKGIVLLLCEKIDKVRGVRTFRDDRDIDGGDTIPTHLLGALRESAEMLVLLTPTSVQRPWVQNEIGTVWALGKRIVPVFHLLDPKDSPPLVREAKAYPLAAFDHYLTDLRKRVRDNRGKS